MYKRVLPVAADCRDASHHAATPSFLLYEIADKQVAALLATLRTLGESVEKARLL